MLMIVASDADHVADYSRDYNKFFDAKLVS